MRDIKQLKGKPIYLESIEEILAIMHIRYIGFVRQSSNGSMSFYWRGELVGEAWLHRTKKGWFLRVKNIDEKIN